MARQDFPALGRNVYDYMLKTHRIARLYVEDTLRIAIWAAENLGYAILLAEKAPAGMGETTPDVSRQNIHFLCCNNTKYLVKQHKKCIGPVWLVDPKSTGPGPTITPFGCFFWESATLH